MMSVHGTEKTRGSQVAGRLAGKTALITAAGQGIGMASAVAMAAEGARVYATDLNAQALRALAGNANIETRVLDVLDDSAIQRTLDDLPPLDVLFNCAGYVHQGTILDCTPKDWDFSFNLNVRAMFMTIKHALPRMLEHGGGSIINMASVAGSLKGLPARCAYGASKAAVVGLTKAVAAASAATPSRPAPSIPLRSPSASMPFPIRPKRAGRSSRANRWADLPSPRRLRRSWCFSHRTNPPSQQEMFIRWTAG